MALLWLSSKVVEELLSKSGTIGQEAARAIADAAMLEVASTNVPHMVTKLTELKLAEHFSVTYLQQKVTRLRELLLLTYLITMLLTRYCFRNQMKFMKELHLSILNRFAIFQLFSNVYSLSITVKYELLLLLSNV